MSLSSLDQVEAKTLFSLVGEEGSKGARLGQWPGGTFNRRVEWTCSDLKQPVCEGLNQEVTHSSEWVAT